jgi:iron complex transport system permease protein
MPRRAVFTLAGLAALLAASVLVRVLVGSRFGWPEGEFLVLRVDRVLAAATVGAALATAGVMLQSLLKNPLASPDLIGAASGAGLAVMLAVALGGATGAVAMGSLGAGHGPAALVGSLATLALVYSLAQRRGFVEPVSLVLVGVIVSVTCGAATLLIAHLMPGRVLEVARWVVGSISDEARGWPLAAGAIVTLAGIGLGAALGPAMDVAALGDDEALSSGVPMKRLRLVLFVASGVLTAAAVALAGPIGFVGLVCPHVVRLTAGPSHRTVVIGAALAGASLILLADAADKAVAVALVQGRMPIGIITALVGGPVFILLLRRNEGDLGR